ncbi:MAG: FkbM family methyltransferase [Defluviitaleaceae bacterium]|nr:FkbM family methyltransferase [Defluviitaleaceae bacterium]
MLNFVKFFNKPPITPNIAPIVSNGEIDITEINFIKKFLIVTNTDVFITSGGLADAVSTPAKKGELAVDYSLYGLFKKPGTFLDIGANIGTLSLSLAALGWQGYAFEASSQNASVLKKSICINDFNIKVVEQAVSDKTGEIYFVQKGPWGVVQNNVDLRDDYEKLSCTSLDDWNDAETSIDFIKMDIEGSEAAAFRGMYDFLARHNYPPIFVEVNLHMLSLFGETRISMLSHAKKMGYKPYKLEENSLRHVEYDSFPENVVEDLLLIKDSFDNINYPIKESSSPNENKIVENIINNLQTSINHQGIELCFCYALKDYPNYYNQPEIKNLLKKLYAIRNADDRHIKNWTDWIGDIK